MERKIGSIRVSTEKGREVILDEFQEFIDGRTEDDPSERWLPGPRRLEVRGGGAVKVVDEGTFEIAATGQRLTLL